MSGPLPALAAAILAGGSARRLGGVCKPLLQVGAMPILDRQLAVLRELGLRCLVVAAPDSPCEALRAGRAVEIVRDVVPGAGPLGGLHAALAALRAEETGLLCLGGDLPFVPVALLRELCARAGRGPAAVVPRGPRGPEPLCAVYHRELLVPVEHRLRAGQRALVALLAELDAGGRVTWLEGAALRALDPADDLLVNVNTPEELSAAERRARPGPG